MTKAQMDTQRLAMATLGLKQALSDDYEKSITFHKGWLKELNTKAGIGGWLAQGQHIVDPCPKLTTKDFVQEPPQDYRIFNKRQADGTFKPLSEFFGVVAK